MVCNLKSDFESSYPFVKYVQAGVVSDFAVLNLCSSLPYLGVIIK